MHVHYLDPYQEKKSLVHQLDARIKLGLAVAFILTAALTPTAVWPVYVLLLALTLALEVLSELGIPFFLKRAVLAAPFVLAALPVMFTIDGPAVLALPFGLTVTQPGIERFLSIALKSWISVQIAILLASSTPFPDLLSAMRAWRLPRLLVAIVGLMWRYLFVMVDETLRLMQARDSRSSESDTPGLKSGGKVAWRAQVTGRMAGSLFLRSLERSDRIYMAMLARGYDGEIRLLESNRITPGEWLVLAAGLFLLGLLLAFGYLVV